MHVQGDSRRRCSPSIGDSRRARVPLAAELWVWILLDREIAGSISRSRVLASIQAADNCVRFLGDWISESTRCLRVW
jgi:hypothetical protein